uniref:Protein kinase domain-containing protein n=1 Tax=Fagus sylvatica TaxID=28930 RepID=A0A2N9JA44_FAGSY
MKLPHPSRPCLNLPQNEHPDNKDELFSLFGVLTSTLKCMYLIIVAVVVLVEVYVAVTSNLSVKEMKSQPTGIKLFHLKVMFYVFHHITWTFGLEGGSVYFGVPVFSYSELKEATNNFDSEKELGDGGFGTVYHGKMINSLLQFSRSPKLQCKLSKEKGKLHDGREVAVKRLYGHNYRRVEQFENEVEILTRLRHKNLVSLYGCTSRHCRELLLVYEYIPNGTVADHIHGNRAIPGSLKWPTRMSIAIETATALAYLHASDIIHRDIKTNNILLDNNFCVKVADFGLSRLFPNDVSHVSTAPQGTPGYLDPEYRQCYQLTKLAFRCLQQDKDMRPSMDEVLEALKTIQSGEDAREDQEMAYDDDGVLNVQQPALLDPYEVGLLNCKSLPPSPGAPTDNWISRSITPNVSI